MVADGYFASAMPLAPLAAFGWDDPDEHATDVELVDRAAVEYLGRYGSHAVTVLRDMEEIARDLGDALSAETWRDVRRRVQERVTIVEDDAIAAD